MRLAERGSPAQAVSQFIEQRLPMLILADVGNVAEAREQLSRWIEDGGVLCVSPARGLPRRSAQPLLASTYYLTRALGPFADVRLADRGSPAQAVSQFIEQRLPMLILADVGNVSEARDQLTHWIEEGGVLVPLCRTAARSRRR